MVITCDNAEIGDKSDDESIMPVLLSKEEMDVMDSRDESEDEHISTEMLEYIRDGSQSHTSVNKREVHYKIFDRIKRGQFQWKGALLSTQNIGKGLHKVFNTVVKEIS